MSSTNRGSRGLIYDPATGTYMRPRKSSQTVPPPLPPKETDPSYSAEYISSPITKETHQVAELEGDVDVGGLSLEDTPGESPFKSERRREKRAKRQPRKKRQLRILSLDGGGIRGYSTLVILQELMHQIYVQTHDGKGPRTPADLPRPCDYFDLIGGTGTGGLIALMLGRMRMDVESCKEYYVQLTRYVFITDKTVLGVPYGKTLFKASRLEEAIRHCVRESTKFDSDKIIPHSPPPTSPPAMTHKRSGSWADRISPIRRRASSLDRDQSRGRRGSSGTRKAGDPEAPLFDNRPGRCRTFVTAVYKGTPPKSTAPPALLRTYPSAAESVPSYNCTIWQAGRATSAIEFAFKPISIEQNTFLDEGSGIYNPAMQALEEARNNEFPGDKISVFVSVGTGKRHDALARAQDHHRSHSHGRHHGNHSSVSLSQQKAPWWEGLISTPFEDFSEARKRLYLKVDDCERVHRILVDGEEGGRPGLAKMGVPREDYYRFNVEVGVGEFALNEWNRLTEVSTGTRRYLGQRETSNLVRECASKLVRIDQANTASAEEPSFMRDRIDKKTAPSQNSSPPRRQKPSQPQPQNIAELSADHDNPPTDWTSSADTTASSPSQVSLQETHPAYRISMPDHRQHIPQSPTSDGRPQHYQPMMAPGVQVEKDVAPPQLPPKPPNAGGGGSGGPLYHQEHPYYRMRETPLSMPNPEIRVTSPTTVAGGDSDEERRGGVPVGGGRRRRRRGTGGS
ncbi:FabD/lysophospholipase-like protein [Choiromyces venosus 120613-1]|uniref:FabD/lysophospholipase-like protein n=1 Tax=Choiromyces venosus 120613-1 TaxID=1336337 RepID=A0A3N4IZJ1_9PEZI|nr:FabD/lysophospholipase-like protein [Choiromyces venosus 120613-1]